ncbi:MAG: Eco57I restriction-modification methylase domain-containing protein [Candidatus Helarchaeota archaeon]
MQFKLIEVFKEFDKKFISKKRIISVFGKEYPLYIFSELSDEDLNIYRGILIIKTEDESLFNYLKNIYKPSINGFIPRIGVIIYDGQILIKDFKKNKLIIKTIEKINQRFINKFRDSLFRPTEENISKLFDRRDIIEEFYILYKKAREYLIKNIKTECDEQSIRRFIDYFILQMFNLWFLQERGFFNNDRSYLITKFNQFQQNKLSNRFKTYYDFLIYLFEKIGDFSYNNSDFLYEDEIVGSVVIVGPTIFLEGLDELKNIKIPNKCFYIKGKTEILINTISKKIDEIPILNILESRDWKDGNVDEFVLGAIYEKLITFKEKKRLGAYYTPESITAYICENTIIPYLIEKINNEFKKEFKVLDEILEENNKEILSFLFELLGKIRILDPAVGSAHFLGSAINTLVHIYKKVWNKARDLNLKYGFEIITTDEIGNIKIIRLTEISDEDLFLLYMKYFIIFSNNIYGSDIKSSTLRIARARLFLLLAKHYKPLYKDKILIRFQKVHFNLKMGNSLIGFGKLKDDILKNRLIIKYNTTSDEKYDIFKKFGLDHELKNYLKTISKSLKINGNIIDEIEDINKIFLKNMIIWKDIEKILRIKEKLLKIILVSLNLQYEKPLRTILSLIIKFFNDKFDLKFAELYNIKITKLKNIGTFHWIFEFPEVFLDNEGFDIIIGNPPYVRQEDINHIVEGINYKKILQTLFTPFENTFDYSIFFLLRSLQLIRKNGYHSFIITNKWLRAKYGKKIRHYLKETFTIKKLIDYNEIKIFPGVNVDILIYIILNKTPKNNNLLFNHPINIEDVEKEGFLVNQNDLNDDVWNFINPKTLEIKEHIDKIGIPLKDLNINILTGIKTGFNKAFIINNEIRDELIKDNLEMDIKIFRGLTTGCNKAFIIDNEIKNELIKKNSKFKNLIKPLLRGKDISRYYIEWAKLWIIAIPSGFTKKLAGKSNLLIEEAESFFKKELYPIYKHLNQFRNTKMRGKGLLNRDDQGDFWWELRPCDYYDEFEKPKIIWQEISVNSKYSWDLNNFYVPNNAYIMSNISKPYLLILNSRLIDRLFKFISQYLSGGYRHTKQYIEKIIIRLSGNVKPYEILVDYLLFLNSTQKKREKFNDIITFFDRQIADSIVYELYFKEKFHDDGLYSEPHEYLLDLISEHLNPIDYDHWNNLFWKLQIEENLTDNLKNKFNSLNKKNLEIIIEVYEKLCHNNNIQNYISRILSHPWVKQILSEL